MRKNAKQVVNENAEMLRKMSYLEICNFIVNKGFSAGSVAFSKALKSELNVDLKKLEFKYYLDNFPIEPINNLDTCKMDIPDLSKAKPVKLPTKYKLQ